MATAFLELNKAQIEFIKKQKMFFVASAPLSGDGHVNLSPKGYKDTFKVIDNKTVAYLDLGGSGIETHSHLSEDGNGRICICFMSFEGRPLILRLYGKGISYPYNSNYFNKYRDLFENVNSNSRGIIVINLDRTQQSCGWGVPEYQYKGDRSILKNEINQVSQEQYFERRLLKDKKSIDNIDGLK